MKVIIVASACIIASVQSLPYRHQGTLYNGHSTATPATLSAEAKASTDHVEELTFTQRLDHFDRQIDTTFQQRYFVDKTYYNGQPNTPVFLCVGGEGPPLDKTVLVASDHCNDMVELAQSYGALLLALEHRYYGPSNPFDDYSTENLKWLNSEQALSDIAYFHHHISSEFGLTSNNRWVTWGGSYPGMMAAMARLRFPHLIWASVSSSSPLQAIVDFPGYNDVVSQSISAEIVGGSQECLAVVVDGHKEIGEKLQTTEGRRSLEEQFNICAPLALENEQNREQFAGDGVIYIPVQSNDPSCSTPLCNIASSCELLTDESLGAPIDRLAEFAKKQHLGSCIPVSYDLSQKGLANVRNPERVWMYQTCTEWGFYQTCNEGSFCPYTQGLHDISYDYDMCANAFNVTAAQVDAQIAAANDMYGGANIQATRIMYPNGEIDPWRASGVNVSPNEDEPVLFVKGASHHFWTHPSEETDSDYINEARQAIWTQVGEWLKEQ